MEGGLERIFLLRLLLSKLSEKTSLNKSFLISEILKLLQNMPPPNEQQTQQPKSKTPVAHPSSASTGSSQANFDRIMAARMEHTVIPSTNALNPKRTDLNRDGGLTVNLSGGSIQRGVPRTIGTLEVNAKDLTTGIMHNIFNLDPNKPTLSSNIEDNINNVVALQINTLREAGNMVSYDSKGGNKLIISQPAKSGSLSFYARFFSDSMKEKYPDKFGGKPQIHEIPISIDKEGTVKTDIALTNRLFSIIALNKLQTNQQTGPNNIDPKFALEFVLNGTAQILNQISTSVDRVNFPPNVKIELVTVQDQQSTTGYRTLARVVRFDPNTQKSYVMTNLASIDVALGEIPPVNALLEKIRSPLKAYLAQPTIASQSQGKVTELGVNTQKAVPLKRT